MSPQRRYGLKKRIGFGVAGILGLLALARWGALSSLFSANYLPHGYWYLAKPALIWTNALADGLIAVSYALLFGCLFWLAGKVRRIAVLHQYLWILIGFGLFILACDLTHGMEIVTIWRPAYPLAAAFKVACAAVSFLGAVLFARAVPEFTRNILHLFDPLARAQRETEDEAANYRGQIEAINQSQMMIEFRMDGTIIKANSNYLRTFGYQDAELTDRHHSVFVTKEYKQSIEYRKFWEELRAGHYQAGLFSRIAKQGNEVWIEASYNPILGPNGVPMKVVKFASNVTELVQANEMSQQALEIAKDSNRTKSDFLANMSHEIRTPMNAILGMTYLARRSDPTPKQLDYLTKIGHAAQSLLSIMNDILDFSKIEAGKLQLEVISFSLQDVLRNLLDVVGQEAQDKGIALVSSVAKDAPPFLVGDPLRLGQILINLVNNAVKFTDLGEISIRVVAEEITLTDLRLNISVSDTGIGMSPEQIANLFRSFQQGNPSFTRKYGGTGLGLAISKQLCDLMQGKISVESELGKGSTFHFTARFGIAADVAASLSTRQKAPRKEFVLIVDDSESTRDLLVAMLDANGFRARAVSSGEEALSALAHASQTGQPIDLVLMDWRLPGMDGAETSRRIKADPSYSLTPEILMVSAFESQEVLAGQVDRVFNVFLSKPFTEKQLMSAIATAFSLNAEPGAPMLPGAPHAVLASELAGRRVLLVEDNEVNRFLAEELLSDLGIHVTMALNGREGIDKVNAEPFDLVLMDIQMPVMDGLTATQLIRADSRFQSLPIVAMTAHAMSGDRQRSLLAGMNDHLTKPISPKLLTEMLLQWMPARSIAQPVIETENEPATPSADVFPDQLPPFDIPAALARANGKTKLLRKMMLSFREHHRFAASELRQQIAEGKTEEANRLAHSLQGVAATLEARDLANAAASIEHAIREGAMHGLGALIETMKSTLDPAIAAVSSLDRRVVPPSSEPAASSGRPDTCILLVDDQSGYLGLLKDIFGSHTEVLYASNGLDALRIAAARVPDMILLDVMMAGIDGYEVFSRLKADPSTTTIPVIFLTSLGSVADETKGLTMGACDYVTKPINPVAVRTRVTHQIQLRRAQQESTRLTAEEHAAELAKEEERAAEVVRISQ